MTLEGLKGEQVAKIAISLPDEMYQAVEKERLAKGESRSQFFRRAVEEHLRRAREREDVERYIRGYQQYPWRRKKRWHWLSLLSGT